MFDEQHIKPLKGKQRKAFIYELHLEGHSARNIAEHPEIQLSHTQVIRDIQEMDALLEEEARQQSRLHLLKDLKKLEALERQAWEGWRRSVGEKTKTTRKTKVLSDDDDPTVIEELVEDTSVTWADAGDPRFIQQIRECIAERHRLLGTYRQPPEELQGGNLEAIRLEQAVYVPGIGHLEPQVIMQLIQGSGQGDLWHAMYALLQNQHPHQYHGVNADDSP